jgi:hypothetical protein
MANVANMSVSNPCFQFQLLHNHATDLRRELYEKPSIDASRSMACPPARGVKETCSSLATDLVGMIERIPGMPPQLDRPFRHRWVRGWFQSRIPRPR